MTVHTIITYPHPILRQQADPVTRFDRQLAQLAEDMAETMYRAPGVGLAANQIGILQQIIVVDTGQDEKKQEHIFLVNPVIVAGEGKVAGDEGCLSVIEYQAKVTRFQKIQVTAQDIEGKELHLEAEDRLARIIQHEIDHLLGKLFIDHLSPLKRNFYKKKLKKIIRQRT